MTYLTPLSKLEKMSQDAAFRRECEDKMREENTASNKSTPSSILERDAVVVTISENAQNERVRVVLPLSFPHQPYAHLNYNPPLQTRRLYSQPQESAASFNNTSKKVVVNGVEIPRIQTHLILNMTTPYPDVSSQSSMSASQGIIVNANNNALSTQSPHHLKSYGHIEDDVETSSNLASSQETRSWKAIEEMEATHRDIDNFHSRMSTSQVATDSSDLIGRAPIRPYNVISQSCIFEPQNNNGSNSAVLLNKQNKNASQSKNTNIPAVHDTDNFESSAPTQQITADNGSRLELRQVNQFQLAVQQTQRQNNNSRASSDVDMNNSAAPQKRVGTLMGRVNPSVPVRASTSSKKCKILGLCIFNAFAVAFPVLIGEYCSEDSSKKDFNAILGGMIGLGVDFIADICMIWSRCLS